MAGQSRHERDAARTRSAPGGKRRTLRILTTLLVAFAATFWVGRALGLSNDELFGYFAASLSLVAAAGLVAIVVFGVVGLFRR